MTTPDLQLIYWPMIQGRGECVRLALEDAGVAYDDVARREGIEAVTAYLKRGDLGVYAPPLLIQGDLIVSQTANILQWIAPQIGLAPEPEALKIRANQIQLTLMDIAAEAHDTHHPISTALYYEDQQAEAIAAAQAFVEHRLPGWLSWLASICSPEGYTVGDQHCYTDLSVFQILCGLEYAFPKAMGRRPSSTLDALVARVKARPRVAAYLASARRIPFNEDGIFRRYPALDVVGGGG